MATRISALTVESLQVALAEAKARWHADDTSLTRLPEDQQRLRLGLIADENRLAHLRAQPRPDLADVIAAAVDPRRIDGVARQAAARAVEGLATARMQSVERPWAAGRLFWPVFRVDWRDRSGLNAITPVRNQGACCCCVAFSSVASLESMVLIEHNVSLDLSEAELNFCGGGNCVGWWIDPALAYIRTHGVGQEGCFPYQDHLMPCRTCPARDAEAITISNTSVLFDLGQRKDYLALVGPMIGVMTVYSDLFAYGGGVYHHVTGPRVGAQSVEVIGYDDFQGCWFGKNSWGTGWGEAGFIRIAYGDCDIDSGFPFWGIQGTRWLS